MKNYAVKVIGLLLMIAVSPANADLKNSPERVLWDKRPIPVHIQRYQERVIHFPNDIRYWIPDSIKRKVTVLSANGVLYIQAKDTFPTTRVRVQELESQQLYLLDVTASDSPAGSDELIVMTEESSINRAKDESVPAETQDWRVRLTRYAAQQLYAPERFLNGDPAIQRVPVGLSGSVSLIRGGQLDSIPMAAWQGGGLTVTAIKLRNTMAQPLTLQFKQDDTANALNLSQLIRGHWVTATLQHTDMGASGNLNDTTTLYLVSEHAFIEALGLLLMSKAEEMADG